MIALVRQSIHPFLAWCASALSRRPFLRWLRFPIHQLSEILAGFIIQKDGRHGRPKNTCHRLDSSDQWKDILVEFLHASSENLLCSSILILRVDIEHNRFAKLQGTRTNPGTTYDSPAPISELRIPPSLSGTDGDTVERVLRS